MNIKDLSLLSLVAAMALSTACVVDDDDAGGDTDTDTNATTMTATDPTNSTDPTASTGSTTNVDPDTGETDPTGDTDTDTGDTDTDSDTEADDPNDYMFRDDDPSAYTRVDRQGFPAVNTAFITPENKDAYNAGSPADDVTGTFAQDAIDTLVALHGDGTPGGVGLDDDLLLAETLLGVDLPEPCGVVLGNDSCVEQAVPLAFPDVILMDTTTDSAFPNGRALEVPVIDIILAAVLLEVGDNPAVLSTFATVGLSQSPNDVAFSESFPYLGAAHE